MMNAATAQVQDLINQVKSAPLSTNLQIDPLHQLEDVQNALGTGQIATAVSNLNDFITRVNSLIGKSLTSSQANQLVQAANQIKATLGF